MPPRSRSRGLSALVDVDQIRHEERTEFTTALTILIKPDAVVRAAATMIEEAENVTEFTTALTILIKPDAVVRAAATMIEEAENVLDGPFADRRRELLLSLAFFTRHEGVARVGAVSRPSLDDMRRTALGLPRGGRLPSREAAAIAARAAGVEEIPAALVLSELPGVVKALVSAGERRKIAVEIRQNASLILHGQGKTDWEIAELAKVAPGRVREDLTFARKRLNVTG